MNCPTFHEVASTSPRVQLVAVRHFQLAHRTHRDTILNDWSEGWWYFSSVLLWSLKKCLSFCSLSFWGPRGARSSGSSPSLRERAASVGQIHELAVAPALRLAMPKSMYWLGNALLTWHVLEHLWCWILVAAWNRQSWKQIIQPRTRDVSEPPRQNPCIPGPVGHVQQRNLD